MLKCPCILLFYQLKRIDKDPFTIKQIDVIYLNALDKRFNWFFLYCCSFNTNFHCKVIDDILKISLENLILIYLLVWEPSFVPDTHSYSPAVYPPLVINYYFSYFPWKVDPIKLDSINQAKNIPRGSPEFIRLQLYK